MTKGYFRAVGCRDAVEGYKIVSIRRQDPRQLKLGKVKSEKTG